MNKKHECKEFYAVEEYFLKGNLVDGVLYIKASGGSDGIKDIRCVDCDKEITGTYEIELC